MTYLQKLHEPAAETTYLVQEDGVSPSMELRREAWENGVYAGFDAVKRFGETLEQAAERCYRRAGELGIIKEGDVQ